MTHDKMSLKKRQDVVEAILLEIRKGRKQNGESRILLEEAVLADLNNLDVDLINIKSAALLLSKAARKRLA